MLLGIKRDPQFGPVLVAGAGGIYTEVLKDAARTLAPVTPGQCAAMLQNLKIFPILNGVRGQSGVNIPALVESMGAWSKLPEGLRDRRQAAQGSWRDQPLEEGLKRLVCPIVAKGMARGYLSLVGSADDLDLLDQLVVEHGAAACALEMAKAKAVSEAEKRARGDFVDAVVTGALPLEELLRWALRISYDIEPLHAAVVWRWSDSAGAPSLRRLETLVNQSVVQQGLGALVRPRGNEVVAFCAVAPGGRPEAALTLAETVHHAATDEYPSTPVYSGVGRSVTDVLEWKDSYREATQALSMAIRLREQRPLHFGDLSVYRLLFQLEGNAELNAWGREAMRTPGENGYAPGWVVSKTASGATLLQHVGDTEGFQVWSAWFPADDTVILLAVNSDIGWRNLASQVLLGVVAPAGSSVTTTASR